MRVSDERGQLKLYLEIEDCKRADSYRRQELDAGMMAAQGKVYAECGAKV